MRRNNSRIEQIFARLADAYAGERWHWSPHYVRAPIDIIAGAILVQHTTWANAERALGQLRGAGVLESATLTALPDDVLLPLVRVGGTPTVKARRLRAIAATIEDAGGLAQFLALPDGPLRGRLLATHGVGKETADAIMLYAARRRAFIIDAYTQRLFRRIGIGPKSERYDDWQRYFERALPEAGAETFQRYHAYIVLHGKALCRATPRCAACPLLALCRTGRRLRGASAR